MKRQKQTDILGKKYDTVVNDDHTVAIILNNPMSLPEGYIMASQPGQEFVLGYIDDDSIKRFILFGRTMVNKDLLPPRSDIEEVWHNPEKAAPLFIKTEDSWITIAPRESTDYTWGTS